MSKHEPSSMKSPEEKTFKFKNYFRRILLDFTFFVMYKIDVKMAMKTMAKVLRL